MPCALDHASKSSPNELPDDLPVWDSSQQKQFKPKNLKSAFSQKSTLAIFQNQKHKKIIQKQIKICKNTSDLRNTFFYITSPTYKYPWSLLPSQKVRITMQENKENHCIIEWKFFSVFLLRLSENFTTVWKKTPLNFLVWRPTNLLFICPCLHQKR